MKKYSILVSHPEFKGFYFNNWYSRNITGVEDVLNHLKGNDFYIKNNYKFELVEVTEDQVTTNNLNCLEDILECYLLNDNNLYFRNNKEIKTPTPTSLKWIKTDVNFEDVKEQIKERIFWNGWSIHKYITA